MQGGVGRAEKVPCAIPVILRGMDPILVQIHPRREEVPPVFLVGAIHDGNIGRLQCAGHQGDGNVPLTELPKDRKLLLAGDEIGRFDEKLLSGLREFLIEPAGDRARLGRRILDLPRGITDDVPARPNERLAVLGEI